MLCISPILYNFIYLKRITYMWFRRGTMVRFSTRRVVIRRIM